MLFTIIIPSRFESTRLPGKPLKLINGRPMIQWVYEMCRNIEGVKDVIIATDHEKIMEVAEGFGGKVVMTSSEHVSGTDRCAEVSENVDTEYVINVQGDEPFINPEHIRAMISYLNAHLDVNILTLYHDLSRDEVESPHNVKLVLNKQGKILYFSRSVIPYERGKYEESYFKHIGIYAFRRKTLIEVSQLKSSVLEDAEGLEQLRWLENGFEIYGLKVSEGSFGIDTPQDLKKANIYAEGLERK